MGTSGKKWEALKSDFPANEAIGKPYNAEKYRSLNILLAGMCAHWKGDQRVITLKRKILEEVSNIIQHNQTDWNNIGVRTAINNSQTTLKIEIYYDSTDYYDPKHFKNSNVIGSTHLFGQYERESETVGKSTTIKLSFQF